jgi:hypothetical protein
MRIRSSLLLFVLTLSALPPLSAGEPTRLFNGQSLAGWEGDHRWWRVEQGAIFGGSRSEKIPKNVFLATTRSYRDFDLRLSLRLRGTPNTGMINSGIQIRSQRVPNSTEMRGYQVDAGDGWWGKLYDESRRNKAIASAADLAAVNAAVRPNDWNDYRILAEGPRIRTWINGVPAIDFTETDASIPLDGLIGIQIHSGGVAAIEVREVILTELAPAAKPAGQ